MARKHLDTAFATALLLLGLYVVWGGSQYRYLRGDVPGPGFFPLWTGILLVGVSSVNLVRSFGAAVLSGHIDRSEFVQAGLLLVTILAFALLAPIIGMLAAAVPFVIIGGLVIHSRLNERAFLAKLLALAIIMPGVCYLVFARFLGVPLL